MFSQKYKRINYWLSKRKEKSSKGYERTLHRIGWTYISFTQKMSQKKEHKFDRLWKDIGKRWTQNPSPKNFDDRVFFSSDYFLFFEMELNFEWRFYISMDSSRLSGDISIFRFIDVINSVFTHYFRHFHSSQLEWRILIGLKLIKELFSFIVW